jgi:toxin ParE1/3/4
VKLNIAPAAIAELELAAAFYAEQANATLGLAFVAEFERAANFVATNPSIGSIFYQTRRRYVLRRFPYSIIYQVKTDELRILAVAHHRRKPGFWVGR